MRKCILVVIALLYSHLVFNMPLAYAQTCNPPVNVNSNYFNTIQDAYNSAANGNTVQITEGLFNETVLINRNITTILKGGYNCLYETNSGYSTVNGLIIISNGTVAIENLIIKSATAITSAIIADHTVVDKFNDIPQSWINEVKKMMIYFPGESHSAAYRTGMELLEAATPTYACNVATGEAYTDQYVRVNNGGAGEAIWYTWYAYDGHNGANKDIIKNAIKEYADHGHPMHAIGFGWCWDLTWTNGPGGTIDPVYNVHWAGSSEGGPDGNLRWGLDDGDISLTGNGVTMNTYLLATEEYRLYAISIGTPTKVLFTTSPVDGYTGENGYQRHLKHEHIRSYVAANPDRILFDYADILCYNDSGQISTTTWNGHTYPVIHSDNMGGSSTGHIGSVGAIRLAKAQWWLLARIAGWDGKP